MSEKSEPEQFRKLFIFGLNYQTTEETLKTYFEQWGEIVDCFIMKKLKNTNKSRGFGYITYKRAHMVDDAQAARPHKIDDREVNSKRAVPKKDSNKPGALVTVNKLFVSGIKDDLTEDDLRDYFGTYGNIISVNIVVDDLTGRRRGFAFIEFDDHDPVDKICLERHMFKGKRLEVKKALSRDQLKKIKKKKEMESYGLGDWHTADEFESGNYGARFSGVPDNPRFSGVPDNPRFSGVPDNPRFSGVPDNARFSGVPDNGYRGGTSGGWNDNYGFYNDNYSNNEEGNWGSNFRPSYGGGGPMRATIGYSRFNNSPYAGGRRSSQYGR